MTTETAPTAPLCLDCEQPKVDASHQCHPKHVRAVLLKELRAGIETAAQGWEKLRDGAVRARTLRRWGEIFLVDEDAPIDRGPGVSSVG